MTDYITFVARASTNNVAACNCLLKFLNITPYISTAAEFMVLFKILNGNVTLLKPTSGKERGILKSQNCYVMCQIPIEIDL